MLVIDSVELVFGHQPLKVRKLQRDGACRLEQLPHASDEIIDVGNLRQHIVGHDQVRLLAFGRKLKGKPLAEEVDPCRYPLLDSNLGDIGGGLDAEDRNAEWQEMLQQVAVVAGELDYQ